jgi:hypothetical protein
MLQLLLTNMLNSPDANLAAHNHGELLGGILGDGLKPMVQTNKTSENPMEKVWALPYGRWMSCVFHILNTHGKALEEAGGYVALIMIPEDDPRMNLFTKFGAGSTWAQTCHPAYSMGFYVCPDDVFVVRINDLPACLKQTQVHSDMVKLKTEAEKKATIAAYQASDHGKATRAAYQASDHGKATRAAYQASDHGKATRAAYQAAYQASDHGKAVQAAYKNSDHGKAVKAAWRARNKDNILADAAKRNAMIDEDDRQGDSYDTVLGECEDLLKVITEAQGLGRLKMASTFQLLLHQRLIGLGKLFDGSAMKDEIQIPLVQEQQLQIRPHQGVTAVATQLPTLLPTGSAFLQHLRSILPGDLEMDASMMEHLARAAVELHQQRTGLK